MTLLVTKVVGVVGMSVSDYFSMFQALYLATLQTICNIFNIDAKTFSEAFSLFVSKLFSFLTFSESEYFGTVKDMYLQTLSTIRQILDDYWKSHEHQN